jgi:hypothetical protein
MSKKHYIMIAEILNLCYESARTIGSGERRRPQQPVITKALQAQLLEIAEMLSEAFEEENARFDEERFMRACGFALIKTDLLGGVIVNHRWGADHDMAQALIDGGFVAGS